MDRAGFLAWRKFGYLQKVRVFAFGIFPKIWTTLPRQIGLCCQQNSSLVELVDHICDGYCTVTLPMMLCTHCAIVHYISIDFNALIPLLPFVVVLLSDEVLVWLSVWIEVLIVGVWSSWCHCHPKTPSSLDLFKSTLVLPFWYRLTQVVLEKRLLNTCSSSSCCCCTTHSYCYAAVDKITTDIMHCTVSLW